eukprot:CAMPEP_0181186654 /NCGR_PEP_ID=MMETSP1096-20121128/10147_1 /TAXON_ID=156174 ORGANISM="Chrysochromulina ericina, Strain CCMP281" /NCGR_SAMPLE_ID=MMETSP1096 /ASSEMBLY_ACC=CAM_ASM_000453 /LENGTH=153 /DNA_ID=CAMNT_0023275561 /DNA_START=197 /DNA_END=659 /DNA_ORIENTATION=-
MRRERIPVRIVGIVSGKGHDVAARLAPSSQGSGTGPNAGVSGWEGRSAEEVWTARHACQLVEHTHVALQLSVRHARVVHDESLAGHQLPKNGHDIISLLPRNASTIRSDPPANSFAMSHPTLTSVVITQAFGWSRLDADGLITPTVAPGSDAT